MFFAVENANTMEDLTDWVRPFIIELADICLPQSVIYFYDRTNKTEVDLYDKEEKLLIGLKDTLIQSVTKFSEIVD
jgi:hypothetical protein